MDRKAVSPVIAIVLLLMMTVAAAGAAYFWLTSMQSSMQESSRKSIENIMEASGRRVVAQATLCKPTYPYKGLISYWKMDEGSGDYANDSSGNGNDGTLEDANTSDSESPQGPIWVNGEVGKGLKFDGSDDYVDTPNNLGIFDGTTDFTLIAWVNTDSMTGNANTAISARGEAHVDLRSAQSYRTPTGSTELAIAFGGTEYDVDGTDIRGEGWILLTGIYDADVGMKLYENTTLVDSNTQYGSISSRTAESGIGRLDVGHGFYHDGEIDEVRIYDRALSKNEIQELYEAENHSARRRIDVTVRNIGSEEIPKATWVANLKQDGTNVETDVYNASSIGTGELKTLKFYFADFKPNTEYTIQLQGTGTSTTVSC